MESDQCCVLVDCFNDTKLHSLLIQCGISIVPYKPGLVIGEHWTCAIENFHSQLFQEISKVTSRIASPIYLKVCLEKERRLPNRNRIIYSDILHGIRIYTAGFSDAMELNRLAKTVNYLGGKIGKEMDGNITHCVAGSMDSVKIGSVRCFKIPVLSPSWISECWRLRGDIEAEPLDIAPNYALDIFSNLALCFHGFPDEEKKELEELARIHGAVISALDSCKYLVLHKDCSVIPQAPNVVSENWFWEGIKAGWAQDPFLFRFQKKKAPSTPDFLRTGGVTTSPSRKKVRPSLSELANGGGIVSQLSQSPLLANSIFDVTGDETIAAGGADLKSPHEAVAQKSGGRQTPHSLSVPSTSAPGQKRKSAGFPASQPSAPKSKRYHITEELIQTETNYINILSAILTIFRDGALDPNQPGGAIISPTEAKSIFSSLEPILSIHRTILDNLVAIVRSWTESKTEVLSIGQVWIDVSDELKKVYPPFINFVEQAKCEIRELTTRNARFKAFLRLNAGHAACGRQTLDELLIRPVQRLPSVTLLLKDLVKVTETSHPDHSLLPVAQEQICNVLSSINERKRQMDSHVQLLEMNSLIENLPPTILSSHRTFLTHCALIELNNESKVISKPGTNVIMFLFSDCLVICKNRIGRKISFKDFKFSSPIGSGSNPSSSQGNETPPNNGSLEGLGSTPLTSGGPGSGRKFGGSSKKPYKFLAHVWYTSIKRVVDLFDDDKPSTAFALICRDRSDCKETLTAFAFSPRNAYDKRRILDVIMKAIASVTCITDPSSLVTPQRASDVKVTLPSTGVASGVAASSATLQRFITASTLSRRSVANVAKAANHTPSVLRRMTSKFLNRTPLSAAPRNENSLTPKNDCIEESESSFAL